MTRARTKKGTHEKGDIPPGLRAYQERRRQEKEALERGLQPDESAESLNQDIAEALPGDLAEVFLEMKRAMESKDAKHALETLRQAMGRLPAEQVSELINTPTYQEIAARAEAAGLKRMPGAYIRNAEGKVIGREPWRREDYMNEEKVAFLGEENLVFHVNGVRWQVGEGIMTQLPASIYHYYVENRQERRKAATGEGAYKYLEMASGGQVVKE